jgi:hypothetical protein
MKEKTSAKNRRELLKAARAKRPRHSLIWHMQRLRGIKIEHNHEPVRDIEW